MRIKANSSSSGCLHFRTGAAILASCYLFIIIIHIYTHVLAKSEDPDKIQHNAAFHKGLHCFLRLKQNLGTEIHDDLENSTCDP